MIAWGITYVIHSTLAIAAVWIATRLIASTSARETLWTIALFAPFLTATVHTTLPLKDLMRESAPPRISVPASFVSTASLDPAPIERHESPRPLALPLWITASSILLLRLFVGHALFIRSLRDRDDVEPDRERLRAIAAAMGCRRTIRLTQSSAVGSPIAVPRFEIIVPRETFGRLTDDQKDTILAHEVAHLMRRDPLWLLAAEFAKAIGVIQPLNWLVQKKMKECAEFLCDDLAVMHTRNPKALAETLTELAATLRPTPNAIAAMAEGSSNLIARVTRALTTAGQQPLRLITRVAMSVAVVMALAAFAPGIKPATGRKLHTWNATVELTGTRDHVPYSLRIDADDVQYDKETGDIIFTRAASVVVVETLGSVRREFRRDADGINWQGKFGSDRTEWLVDIVTRQASLPANVARSLAKH